MSSAQCNPIELNLYSHPDKKLLDHLSRGFHHIKEQVDQSKLSFERYAIDDVKLAAKIAYIFHDFAKSTPYFQSYMQEIMEKGKSKSRSKKKSHSHLSAIVGYSVGKNILISEELAIFIYAAIKLHHSNIRDFSLILTIVDDDIKLLKDQFLSLKKYSEEIGYIFQTLLNQAKIDYSFHIEYTDKHFEDLLSLKKTLRKYKRIFSDKNKFTDDIKELESYLAFLFIFSSITYGDKSEAIFKTELYKTKLEKSPWSFNIVNEFVTSLTNDSPINKIRKAIYLEALTNIETLNLKNNKILTLTVPTGGGKTLTSLAIATKINEILDKRGKIIYSLPFTSLIEQNQNVFKSILEKNQINQDDKNILTHHYLSDREFKDFSEDDYNYDFDKSSHLIETWNSHLVITTFIQFCNTVFNNRNKNLKRFLQLRDSIILLDEVQCFPIQYHKIFSKVIQSLSQCFNIHFILMTATQPYIFEQGVSREILPDPSRYFIQFNRTKLIYSNEKINISDFNNNFVKQWNLQNEKFLIVMNTINSSIQIFNHLKDTDTLKNKIPFYLSTNIIPKERQKRIKRIKEFLEKKRDVFVVSTQLIEAGVDLDFPLVIRDLAPLDSINQVGGRCNRNGLNEGKPVYLIELQDDNNKSFANYVYDNLLLMITRDILQPEIKEDEFYTFAQKYFLGVKEKRKQNFIDIWQSLCSLSFEKAYHSDNGVNGNSGGLKLIENLPNYANVFVEVDEEAKTLWEKYDNEILSNKKLNPIEKKTKYRQISSQLNQYMVHTPLKFATKFVEVYERSLYRIDHENLKYWYDLQTGVKRLSDEEGDTFVM